MPRFGGAFLLAKRYPNPRRPELPCFDEGTHSGDRGPPHDGTLSKIITWNEGRSLVVRKVSQEGGMVEFLAHMPTDTKIFLTMAVLGLATMLIVLRRLI